MDHMTDYDVERYVWLNLLNSNQVLPEEDIEVLMELHSVYSQFPGDKDPQSSNLH